jgi:tetratricopeptide (TPR) repeat protein
MNETPTVENSKSRTVVIGICVFLFASTWLIFGQTLWHDFINYDDQDYVFANAEVIKGLTGHGILWALTGPHSFNWHPLTSLSHMLDCQIFGLKPGGHHFSSVLFHSVAAVLLFLVLRNMTAGTGRTGGPSRTGTMWPSAMAALLFAIHPLRVESVAWVAERKDVLSGMFFFLTVAAYLRYVRNPTSGRYLVVAFLFAAGLMCKPMLVTLPAILLLLDYWPLGRFDLAPTSKSKKKSSPGGQPAAKLVLEKVPLFALSIASSIATVIAQGSAVVRIEQFPFRLRAMNALTSYTIYIWQMFVPKDLTLLYPLSASQMTAARVAGSVAVLVLITGLTIMFRRTRPYLLVGWTWFLLMLLPVIGLVQVGSQAHADRYTYLPQIGLYIMIVWTVSDISVSWPRRRQLLAGLTVATIAILAVLTRKQTAYWRDSESVWRHAIAATSANDTAFRNLGDVLFAKERYDDALIEYHHALTVNGKNAGAENGLGSAFSRKGMFDQAITHYHRAIELRPQDAENHNNLGNALCQTGAFKDGIAEYRRALELRPDPANLYNAETHFNLANVLLRLGQIDEAIANYQQSLQIQPNDAAAHDNLGTALARKGFFAEALGEYRVALKLDPRSATTNGDFAWVLATCPDRTLRNGPKAVQLAEQARDLTGNKDPVMLRTLAVAYAETGNFSGAVETAERALALASKASNNRLTNSLQREIGLYRTGSTYRPR